MSWAPEFYRMLSESWESCRYTSMSTEQKTVGASTELWILTSWTLDYIAAYDEGTVVLSIFIPFLPLTIITHFQTNITLVT